MAVLLVLQAATVAHAYSDNVATVDLEPCDGRDLDTCSKDKARAAYTENSDYMLDFETAGVETAGGELRGEFVNSNPMLATLPGEGVGQNLITLQPCAINQPTVHPRGTEVAFVTRGTIYFGFLEENPGKDNAYGGRYISNNVTEGKSIVIPQGLLHFAQNLGCESAQFLATFPTRDPGTVTILRALFSDNVPDHVLRATTGLSNEALQDLRRQIGTYPNPSVDAECMKTCGLDMPVEMGEDEYKVALPTDNAGRRRRSYQ